MPELGHQSRSFTVLGVPENNATKGYASLTGGLDWLLLGHWQVLAGCGLGQYRSRFNAMTAMDVTITTCSYLLICERADYIATSATQRLDRMAPICSISWHDTDRSVYLPSMWYLRIGILCFRPDANKDDSSCGTTQSAAVG